ncbi:MAG: hypothetical protein ACTSSP_06565, partial [Candidatus Asgardarchaeia archaeon]
MIFEGAILDIFQTFSVPQIINTSYVNSSFHKFVDIKYFYQVLQTVCERNDERSFNAYFKNVGQLHISPNSPWALILKRWREISTQFNIEIIPPVPVRIISQRPVRVHFVREDMQEIEEIRGKLIVDWYPPFVFVIRFHLDINEPIKYTEIIDLMKEQNIAKVFEIGDFWMYGYMQKGSKLKQKIKSFLPFSNNQNIQITPTICV